MMQKKLGQVLASFSWMRHASLQPTKIVVSEVCFLLGLSLYKKCKILIDCFHRYWWIELFFFQNGWPMKAVEAYFQQRPLQEVLSIANLLYATHRIWTCPELEVRHVVCTVVLTTTPWRATLPLHHYTTELWWSKNPSIYLDSIFWSITWKCVY